MKNIHPREMGAPNEKEGANILKHNVWLMVRIR
jgi:hypothetical protein